MTTEQIILTSRPKGLPTLENFRFKTVELPHLQSGEVLLKGIYYSVDPISNLNFHARIALCGQISPYNSADVPMGPRLQPMLLTRSVLMQGSIIGDYQSRFTEGIKQLAQWLKEGKLKFTETIIFGFEELPTALLGLFKGKNTGKMIVEI